MRRKFNQEMFTYLKRYGRHHTLKEWHNIINDKFAENFTLKDTQMYFVRHEIPFKYEMVRKSNGGLSTALPIGAERIKADGMVQVKIGQRRLIYQEYYKVKLTSDDYIIFLDQDRNNFDISNLKRVSRRESSILANQKIFSKNAKVTELGISVAKTIIKAKDCEAIYAKRD